MQSILPRCVVDVFDFISFFRNPTRHRIAKLERLYAPHACYVYQDMEYEVFLQTPYWLELSDIVKQRDGYRCVNCKSSRRLQVHHKTYEFRGWDHRHLYTLITLCDNCHNRVHGITSRIRL